ncbi:MAG: C45 family peptidase [Kiritimatiellales bacterium]|nr:C45 family peptidase [Kiritimatiellales bacterium]
MKNRYVVSRLCVVVFVAALFLTLAGNLHACTLWGAAGSDASGGTIISKNRDWKPDHMQVLKMHRNEKGYAYFGLCTVYAEESTKGVVAGVNEKALTVFTAAAGSLPSKMWKSRPVTRRITSTLLQSYAICDDVLANKDAIFSSMRPAFIMISDRKKILMVEVGLDGKYTLKTIENGSVAHTNHFMEETLAEFNIKIGESSLARLDRIKHLLNISPRPCMTDSFALMSKDRHDGPDNSLWRTGKVARTLASWIVETPARGAPKLRVVIANPGQKEETHVFVLDERFWRETK